MAKPNFQFQKRQKELDKKKKNEEKAQRKLAAKATALPEENGKEEVTEHWYDQLFLVSHDVAFTEITDQIIQVGEQ